MASAYNENYYDITPQIQTLAQLCTQAGAIDPALYGRRIAQKWIFCRKFTADTGNQTRP